MQRGFITLVLLIAVPLAAQAQESLMDRMDRFEAAMAAAAARETARDVRLASLESKVDKILASVPAAAPSLPPSAMTATQYGSTTVTCGPGGCTVSTAAGSSQPPRRGFFGRLLARRAFAGGCQ